jgi:hypothetical protein
MHRVPASDRPVVVLPSYNGARKLPVLTPLLALLLAREGLPVLMHGTATESSRVFASDVLAALGVPRRPNARADRAGQVAFVPTAVLCPGWQRLLDVRRVVGLRNPGAQPGQAHEPGGRAGSLVVGSYTHPEYAVSMAATFELMGANALLLRGTEGEPVADPRRTPQMDAFRRPARVRVQEAQTGSWPACPSCPPPSTPPAPPPTSATCWPATCRCPPPIAQQVEHILRARPVHHEKHRDNPAQRRNRDPGGRRPRRSGTAHHQGRQGHRAATVLLVDDLVSDAIVALAPPKARA